MALALIALVPPAGAIAHGGPHLYESVIRGIVPAEAGTGIEVRMKDYDERVEIVNRSGRTVIVEGYWGEPYAKIESEGPVYVNALSPSMAPSNDRLGRTEPNGNEDAAAEPSWVRVGEGGTYRWYDRRSHYRRNGVPEAVADEAVRTSLWTYSIPLRVGDRAAAIEGELFWAGRSKFPTSAFLLVLLSTAGCALLGAWAIRRMREP